MSFRFLHIADLHLETAFGGFPATRERLAQATLRALQQAVDLCVDEEVDALLIAGDAFDEDKLSLSAEAYFMGELRRAQRHGVQVFYVTGNHDPGSSSGRAAEMGFSEAPDSVGPEAGLWLYRKGFPKATTVLDSDGQPRAIIVGAGHSKANVSTNLAAKFRTPKQAVSANLPVIGLLHTQVESARLSDAHAKYAPSTRADYEQNAFDYWALGHVHVAQRVFDDLPVYYSGNLQGRNAKETGPKGGWLVQLRPGEEAFVRFVSLAPVQWHQLKVTDLESADSRDSLLALLSRALQTLEESTGLLAADLCVRLLPSGPCPMAGLLLQEEERESLALDLQERGGFLEVHIRASHAYAPRDLTDLESTPSVQREALQLVRQLQEDDQALLALAPLELPGADFAEVEASREARLQYLRERLVGLEEELLDRCFEPEAWK